MADSKALYHNLMRQIQAAPEASPLGLELLALAGDGVEVDVFAGQALAAVARMLKASAVQLCMIEAGSPRLLASTGGVVKPPAGLLLEALDREQTVTNGDWQALPLAPRSGSAEVLAVQGAKQPKSLESVAAALCLALLEVRREDRQRKRIRRLEMLLTMTQEWNRTSEMEPLLVQMAEAATTLLDSDRASIFLWDKPNKTLVARPALGVPGGVLRIPEETGIVGYVIRTGQPRRIDAHLEQSEINREVDQALKYSTETLLCVPLVSNAGEVMGAFEVLNKKHGNYNQEDEAALEELAAHASVALQTTQQLEDLLTTNRQLVDQAATGLDLIGASSPIEALRSTIKRVADTDLAILILGENGTGKEVVSRSIHYLSRRRDQPCIAVNCAALTETLLESELFGHEKGAFTDAHEARAGKFELASGGTLFLDEIGDLSLGGQAKLLRVLEEKIVVRVGGSKPIHTDARVLAATNQNLAEMVRAKRFREDLFYRLNVVTLELPPLRDRGDDIVLLAEHFLKQFARNARRKLPKLTAGAKKRLVAHNWPGNVRELRNLMERLAYLLTEDKIEPEDLAFILSPGSQGPNLFDSGADLTEATKQFQTEYIRHAIDRTRGNMSEAAEMLGLHRSNLYRKMRQLDMPTGEE
jgi:transcriptional regulator with GAF, ATPase, and Fis domain